MTEMSPEVKAALEEQKKNCIFCKIINGDMPSKKIFEDDLVFGVLDINPARKGHVLLMPKEHYPIMPFLPEETFRRLFEVAQTMCKSVKKGIVSTGSTIFIANGFAAGQQSQHFMIHIIPRDQEDNLPFSDLAGQSISDIAETERLIQHNLPIMVENHLKKNPADWHAPRDLEKGMKTSIEKVIQIVEQNPPLKDLIMKEPQEFLKQARSHPQLKPLFENIDPFEIVHHFNPDAVKTVEAKDEGFKIPDEEEKETPEDIEPEEEKSDSEDQMKNVSDEDADLDDIARLFK